MSPSWGRPISAPISASLEPRKDHADYIADWLGVLREDAKAIFTAAAAASRASQFLFNLQEAAP